LDFETCARVTRDPFSHPIRVESPPHRPLNDRGRAKHCTIQVADYTRPARQLSAPCNSIRMRRRHLFLLNLKPPPVSFEMARDRVTWPTEMQNGRWNASIEGVTLHDVTGRTIVFLFLSLWTSDSGGFDLHVSRSLICINREIEKSGGSADSAQLWWPTYSRSNDLADFEFWDIFVEFTTNRLAHLHTGQSR